MTITGKVLFIDANKFGYSPSLKVNGVKYGGDTKGTLPAGIVQGSVVSFEAFETESNGKTYPKYKLQSLKIVNGASSGRASSASGAVGGTSRDDYWAEKDAKDAAKEPRIVYLAAIERATSIATLVLAQGALPLPKEGKNRLEPILAFIDEQTQRLIEGTYAQKVPSATKVVESEVPNEGEPEEATASEEEWS